MRVSRRFNWHTTAEDVVEDCDLTGKKFLITGSTNGIGFETASALASKGADVIISGRSEFSCNDAAQKIKFKHPNANVDILPMDLASLQSVRTSAAKLIQHKSHLNGLILNAGVYGIKWQLTEDGFDKAFQVNYLSQVYLVILLESLLRENDRVIIVSSNAHLFSFMWSCNTSLEWLSPRSSRFYIGITAYSDNKLCNVLFGIQLSKIFISRGVDVMIVDPGSFIKTKLSRHSFSAKLIFSLSRPFAKSVEQGAATSVYCASAPELIGCTGRYYKDCYISNFSRKGTNEQLAKLWELTISALRSCDETIDMRSF